MDRYLLLFTVGLTLLFNVAVGEIPSYIQICGLRNPNLNKCVIESVLNLKPKLITGFSELEVPPLDPLDVEEIPLADLPEFRAIATNVKLSGLSKFVVSRLNIDLNHSRIDIELTFPEIIMDSDYDVKAKIIVPISEKGPINTITDNVTAKATIHTKIIERKGKSYIFFPSMTIKINILDYKANFMPGANDNPIAQAINSVLVNSRKDIIVSMTPNIEKAVSKKILEIANKISKHFTFDELFPDRL